MKKSYIYVCLIGFFVSFQNFGQYCSPSLLCDVEEILNVSFLEIENETGGCTPFSQNDFTDMVANVEPGETYSFTGDFTFDAGFPSDNAYVFIDWNQDGTLNDPGEYYVIVETTGASGQYTIDIDVPSDAEPGETRMRVLVFYHGAPPSPPDPCISSDYAEAEDYTVNVGGLSTNSNSISGFSFYPNPISDVLNLKASVNLESVVFYNLLGQQVISKNLDSNLSQVSLSELQTGTYMMKVISGSKTEIHQIIKK